MTITGLWTAVDSSLDSLIKSRKMSVGSTTRDKSLYTLQNWHQQDLFKHQQLATKEQYTHETSDEDSVLMLRCHSFLQNEGSICASAKKRKYVV